MREKNGNKIKGEYLQNIVAANITLSTDLKLGHFTLLKRHYVKLSIF